MGNGKALEFAIAHLPFPIRPPIGAALARLTGLAGNILFGLTPADPAVFIVAAAILTLAAVFAGWLPAHRASRVDPLVALRHE
jgi:putative ABC transport system permease protein